MSASGREIGVFNPTYHPDVVSGPAPRDRTPKVRQPTPLDIAASILELPDSERLKNFAGKVGFITGATNGIGASSLFNLGDAGAQVVTMSRSGADDQFTAAAAQLGIEPTVIKGDLTDSEARRLLVEQTVALGNGGLDFVVLNASGVGPDVNVTANLDIVRQALPHMREGGVIVLEQSVAHYHKKITGTGVDDHHYASKVSPSKYEGEQRLWALEPEIRKRGLRLFVKVSGVAGDSKNVVFFRALDRRATDPRLTIDGLQTEISDKLGIPAYTTIDDMGRMTRKLLGSDRQSGHVELYKNNVYDVKALLRHWYNADTTFPDTVEVTGQNEGIGRMLVSVQMTAGHFNDLPILPAHISMEAAWQTIGALAALQHFPDIDMSKRTPVLIKTGDMSPGKPIKPGDAISMRARIEPTDRKGVFGGTVVFTKYGETNPYSVLYGAVVGFIPRRALEMQLR